MTQPTPSKVIRVQGRTFERLQQWAEGFAKPNDVINDVLDAAEEHLSCCLSSGKGRDRCTPN